MWTRIWMGEMEKNKNGRHKFISRKYIKTDPHQ